MSIEEKARAYDKAAKVIKDNLDALNEIAETGAEVVNIQSIKNCFYRAFTELKESESEKIRKALIFHYRGDGCVCTNEYRIDYKDIRAWLEKQDPHYTFKIKKGHWYKCVCDYMLNGSDLIFKNDRLYYCRKDWRLEGEIDERNVKDIGVNGYKSFFRPATNQEIKDWLEKQDEQKSVSCNEEDKKIINFLRKCVQEPMGTNFLGDIRKVDVLAWLEKQGEQKSIDYENADSVPKTALEAIKEEKVDNQNCVKPEDKVELIDKFKGLTDFERTLADICIGWIGEELGWKQYIKDNADRLLKIAIKKFNSIKEEHNNLFEEVKYTGCVEKQGEQKLTKWSSRDNSYFEELTEASGLNELQIEWLTEIKDRVLQQPKQEWSEEDEHRVEDIIYFLDTAKKHYASTVELDACIDWLKSLSPQNKWKPSDEQLEAFEHFVRSVGESGYASPYDNNTKLLHSLLSDLKKLREE